MRIPLCRCTLIGVLFASRVFASACVTTTLDVYVALGATGCTINNEPVFNFTFSVPSESLGYTPLLASQIEVTPIFTGSGYTVTFSSVPNNGFSVGSSQSVEYEINFTWDPVVVRAEDDLDPIVPPAFASLSTSLCIGALFSPGCGATPGSLFVMNSGSSSTTFSAVTTVDTQTLLTLNATSGGSSSITNFSESVFTSPEPGSLVLAASGFLGLWTATLLRRRGGGRL